MEFNPNYPWYLQQSENFAKLYEGLYDVAKNISPLDVYKIMFPTELTNNNLKLHAQLWGYGKSWSATSDALIYNENEWSGKDDEHEYQNKYWSGTQTEVSGDWYLRYIQMKAYIQNRPFSLKTIKEGLDILMGNYLYEGEVEEDEEDFTCTIKVAVSGEALSALQGILSYDGALFGKPVGIRVVYNFIEG